MSCQAAMLGAIIACLAVIPHSAMAVAAPDPTCKTGIPINEVCCASECGTCGGENCQNRPGGEEACCSGGVRNSGRLCKDTGPPCILPPPPPIPPTPPSAVVRPKRGFVADGVQSYDTLALMNVSGWFYDYNIDNPFRKAGLKGDCATMNATQHVDERFSPMSWCLSGMNASVPNYINSTFFLGFNEPNNLHNCNKEPEDIAIAWKQIMEKWPDSKLVSPATAGDGQEWFDAFFGNCSKLYGSSGCNISYLAVHDYSCEPNVTLSFLEKMYKRYGYKIWMTEFSCGDHASGNPTSDHMQYMYKILPMLDAAPYVYRYSWMSLHDASGLRGLVENDADGNPSLTALGKLYLS